MKFSNGNWLNREGVEIHSPQQVQESRSDDASLTLYAPCKHVANRGQTLDGPMLTIRLSSPLPDVIRVQVEHFQGLLERGPHFEIADMGCEVVIHEDDSQASLTSGNLRAVVKKHGGWSLEFYDRDQYLTGSGFRGMGYVIEDKKTTYMREQLGLSVGENVYGLGERFTPFVKNGQTVDIWNEDGGTSSDQSYKNIPFYVTNKGYGVFVNHPERVSFEVAAEVVSKVQFSVPGESLEYFIIGGPTMKDAVARYAELTGKPALPPAWTFGLWLTTSFTTDYDELTVTHFIDGMKERDVPLHVFHFDCFWMKEYEWCNFEWDERVFPDPQGMLRRLRDKGLHVCVWINPYIGQKSPLFKEGAAQGYLLKRPNGDVWQWDLWQAGMGIVDFTNPGARAWFADHLRRLAKMGVDSFKTDFGERIPTDVVYYDGSDPVKMHNYYTYLYNQTVFETLQEVRAQGDAAVFARSATVGSQKFPVHWGGDCKASYESMAESLRGGLSLSLNAFGFWSHDIGGFENTATPDLYKRWAAFGLFSTHSRLHGSSSYRVPWLFDEEAVDVLRHFTKLKCSLMPYIYEAAVYASQTGVPVMRPMVLEFPDDPTCAYLDRQYMLGSSVLVAPVFSADGKATCYLPKGKWMHLLTGQEIAGGTFVSEVYDYFSLPVFVRENSLVAIGQVDNKPDYDYADGVSIHVFSLVDGQTARTVVPGVDGKAEVEFVATRVGNRINVTRSADSGAVAGKPWSVVLRGIHECKTVRQGHAVNEALGIRVSAGGSGTIEVEL